MPSVFAAFECVGVFSPAWTLAGIARPVPAATQRDRAAWFPVRKGAPAPSWGVFAQALRAGCRFQASAPKPVSARLAASDVQTP